MLVRCEAGCAPDSPDRKTVYIKQKCFALRAMQGELVRTFSSSFHLPLPFSALLPVPKSGRGEFRFLRGQRCGRCCCLAHGRRADVGTPGHGARAGQLRAAGRAGVGRRLTGDAVAFLFFSFPAKKVPAF